MALDINTIRSLDANKTYYLANSTGHARSPADVRKYVEGIKKNFEELREAAPSCGRLTRGLTRPICRGRHGGMSRSPSRRSARSTRSS